MDADVTIAFIAHPAVLALFLVVLGVHLGLSVVRYVSSFVTG